jgi:2,3-bisphosphoglycerate-independent phosphoglycerate mutase
MNNRVALVILDGRGMTTALEKSATAQAKTPFIDSLYATVPRSELEASEEAVGLPKGQVGNSEVGHSTLGTGRVNYQHLVRISKAIEEGSFFQYHALLNAISYAQKNNKHIHLVGLVSDGGVHSHIQHLFACIELLHSHDQPFYVHAITDGRDTDPESGL